MKDVKSFRECILITGILGSLLIYASILILDSTTCKRKKETFSCQNNIDITQKYFHHNAHKVNCLSTRCRAEGIGQTNTCSQLLQVYPKWGTLPVESPPCAEGSNDWSCDTAKAHAAYIERRRQEEEYLRKICSWPGRLLVGHR